MSMQPAEGKIPTNCSICSGSATCRHFGAFSCKACAAFFRRTIANKKTFTCPRKNNCDLDSANVRRMCAACRIKKCFSVGMQESEVLSLGVMTEPKKKIENPKFIIQSFPITSNNVVSTPTIQRFDHSSVFSPFQTNQWLQQLLISTKDVEHQRITHLPPSPYPFDRISDMPSVAKHVLNETQLCRMFLKVTRIMDSADDIVNEKFADIMCNWNYLVLVLNTLKNDSLPEGKVTMIDHSIIELSDSKLKAWYASFPLYQRHINGVIRLALPTWYKVIDLVTNIYNLRMTNEEQAFFLFLGMIQCITRLTPEPKVTRLRFQPLLDAVFRSMHMYYRENFTNDSTATRMGNIIMALPMMDEIDKLFDEQRVMLSLCHSNLEILSISSLLTEYRRTGKLR